MAFTIAKLDDEQHLVFGFASVAIARDGRPLEDTQEDIIPPEELEKMAYEHVLEFRESDVMHDEHAVGRMVESMVFTPEKLKALATNPSDGTVDEEALAALTRILPTRWWVGYKLDDASFQAVKAGKFPMFSIGGEAEREAA